MGLFDARRNVGVSLVVTVYSTLGIVSLFPPTSWDLGPSQDLFGDNRALNMFNLRKK